jgi:hypothetical protein
MLPKPVRILALLALVVLIVLGAERHDDFGGSLVLLALAFPVLRALALPDRAAARGGLGAMAALLPVYAALLLEPQALWVPCVVDPLAGGPSDYVGWYGNVFTGEGNYFGEVQSAEAICVKLLFLLCAGVAVLVLARAPRPEPEDEELVEALSRWGRRTAGSWFGPVTIRLVLPIPLVLLAIDFQHGWPFEVTARGYSERSPSPLGVLGDVVLAYAAAALVALPFAVRRKKAAELSEFERFSAGEGGPPSGA